MQQSIKDIERAWSYLDQPPSDGSGWRTIPISPFGKITVHAGRKFPERTEAMLVRFSKKPLKANAQLPEGAGFSIETVSRNDDGYWLALSRREHAMQEFFLSMVQDIRHALSSCRETDETQALNIFVGRVKAWQEFMRKGQKQLSPEAEVGLFGELLVLQAIIEADTKTDTALESWIGPLRDGIQDFHLGIGAIEVKSTLSTSGFPAKIGSLDQLDDSSRQPLFVAGVRLCTSDSGMSLNTLIKSMQTRILDALPGNQLFNERLVAVGYLEAHAERYTRLFESVQMRLIEVGEQFPRFTFGKSNPGVISARYEIDLDKAAGDTCTLLEAIKKLKVD